MHCIGAAVSVGKEFQDPFVDGAAYGEPERRVKTVFHIRKILVGKEFEEDGRHRRSTALAVGPVPDLPP